MSRVTLPDPVDVDSFWANRAHDACVTKLSTIGGTNIVDIRKHVMSGGRLVPTPKGIAVNVTRLRDLKKAIDKALRKAIELNLIDDESERGS
jgi:hypothetical protein